MSPLHLDHRPKSLEDFFGNESIKASLQTILSRKDQPRSYLFTGPSGCGKTTLARIIAKEIGCSDRDYHELDIGDTRGIDDARRIKLNLHFAPFSSKIKVYCMDEVHKANDFFQDAMLKALEEPPKHVIFILCTTDPQKLKVTVKRRCHQFEVKPLTDKEMTAFLLSALAKENVNVEDYPSEIISEIIKSSNGSPGIALSILDQIVDMDNLDQIIQVIRKIEITEASIIDLCRALLTSDWGHCRLQLNALPNKVDAEKIRYAVLSYMCKVLLSERPNPQAARVIQSFSQPFYDSGLAGLVLASYLVTRKL